MESSTEQGSGHSLHAHTELVEWITRHGGSLDDSVRVAQDASRGVHIQVKGDWSQPISKETRVLRTPLGVTMSYFNAIGYESSQGSFSKHGVELPQAFIEAVAVEETCTFFLMGQFLRGQEGFWYPYLRTLPQPGELNTPLFFGEEDVDWIQGTGIPEASVQRYEVWDQRYEECISKLEEVGFEGFEEYTWDLYLWASTIISSRAFSPKVLSGVIEASKLAEDSGVSVLLPLIDLPNHRPLAKVEWRAGSSDISMVVLEEVSPGEEISNNYGPRNNEQLLMNYGFCLPNNPTDYRIVKLGVKPDSPLSKAKDRQIEMFPQVANNSDDHYYIFNVFYPLLAPDTAMEHSMFSPALFNSLTVMHANERERRHIEITETSISIPTAYGNGHSTLAALSQISFELIAHIMMLEATGQNRQLQPANLKQTYAQIYRNGQLTLDKAALVVATWTLARAREHNRGESWEDIKILLNEHMAQIPEGHFSAETLSRIRVRILERESLLKKNGELFRLGELFSLLPANMQEASRNCFNHVLAKAGQLVPALQTDPQAMFSLVVCLLVATGQSPQARPQLSPRLTRWVDFLVEQYPPLGFPLGTSETMVQLNQLVQGEQAQAWAVQDGMYWLSEGSGWLDSKLLAWAFNVVEAEMVLTPHEPLQVLVTENPGLPRLGCLYVPQE
ncbi:uncharacterized protein N7482_003980 [Penicillium canariense]|uniref:SET domain-containing protein n=1 Tax=Penicillium canariense TaxID=189055 RepID=A0A9W9LPP0_9EURO|nr:uncharacterized protein N7482_003980 [Penicillium canariense]KAJ5168386.1 hypothetical protein N7482_003980 [Penicillium canariense]